MPEVVTPPLGHRAIGRAMAALTTTLRVCPRFLAYGFADLLVPVLVIITYATRHKSTRKRRGFYHNTNIVFRRTLTGAQRRRLLWRWARHMTHLGVDFCRMPRITSENMRDYCDIEELEVVAKAHAEGRGVIGVTAHVGVYEYTAQLYCLRGVPTTTVYRESPIVPVTDVINRIRANSGQTMTVRSGAIRAVLRALENKDAAGIVADVSSKESEVFAPFLGTNAATNNTAGVLALRTGAVIIVCSTQRLRRRRYKFHVWDVIHTESTGDREADLHAIARRINDALSTAVRAYPEQWFWDSRRYRNRPPGEVQGPDGLPPQVAPEQARMLG